MYSRYTPNAQGGFDRRRVPDPPPPRSQPPAGPGSSGPQPAAPPPPRPQPPAGAGPPGPRPAAPRPPPRLTLPGAVRPPGGLLGPDGLLGALLPRGLDPEELLVLAVLLLAMKQDGAATIELLIAAALYLYLQ